MKLNLICIVMIIRVDMRKIKPPIAKPGSGPTNYRELESCAYCRHSEKRSPFEDGNRLLCNKFNYRVIDEAVCDEYEE